MINLKHRWGTGQRLSQVSKQYKTREQENNEYAMIALPGMTRDELQIGIFILIR